MRRCCFLSMDSLDGYTADDDLAVEPLADLGWRLETVSWRDRSVDWGIYEAVVIRSTWDYQRDPDLFLDVLSGIEASGAKLENTLGIVRGNLDKAYLRSLEADGNRIVPTIWDTTYDEASFRRWLNDLEAREVVIKPRVSATAEYTYRLKEFDPALSGIFTEKPFLVQRFMPQIVAEGEYSLFYFSGEFSHAILKTPRLADFRVQEEHGGTITSATATARMLDAARHALASSGPTPLYARVDLVRTDEDNFALMELEMIEPALYLRMDNGAPWRFAAALDQKMNHRA